MDETNRNETPQIHNILEMDVTHNNSLGGVKKLSSAKNKFNERLGLDLKSS